MVRRFQIEDLMTQDASGVVFRALDTETNLLVAVRRFFPFGVNGGGLSAEEQADYNLAVERLAGISHPAMRAIITGGCDAVDGMPFIATEWVEGSPLQAFIERGPLSPAESIHLLTQALEVCERISQVFGEEAVWVETDAHTIIVGEDASGRGITFWISPLRWLGKNDGQRGLDCIVRLTEDVMGWRGRTILDHEGGGLGGWLKWLRGAARKATLSEAREMLAKAGGATPPSPVRRTVRAPAPVTVPSPKKRKSSIPFLIGGILSLATISLGGWGLIQWNNARLKASADSLTVETPDEKTPTREKTPAPASPIVEESVSAQPPVEESRPQAREKTPDQIRLDAIEFSVSTQKAEQAKASKVDSQKAAIAKRNGVFRMGDAKLLLDQVGEVVTLEGKLGAVERSGEGKGKTIYLVFLGGRGEDMARGGIEVANAEGDLAESALAGLKGKKLRIEGTVRVDGFAPKRYAVVMVDKRSAIQEVP